MTRTPIILLSLLLLLTVQVSGLADEVVLEERDSSFTRIGDWDCAPYKFGSSSLFQLESESAGNNMSAGDLWTFFDQQGIGSMKRLALCVDVDPVGDSVDVGLKSVLVRIVDPDSGLEIGRYTLGNNTLIVPGFQTVSWRPEIRLEVDLGFDFMTRFHAESHERIILDIVTDSGAIASSPSVYVEGKRPWFTALSIKLLLLFVVFWIVVFSLLRRYTLPTQQSTIQTSM